MEKRIDRTKTVHLHMKLGTKIERENRELFDGGVLNRVEKLKICGFH